MVMILIAEDEKDIRDLTAFTLRFAGYEVSAAANGEEALEMAREINPDLIIMDVRMPRMTGYEACKAMKTDPNLQNIPVVFLSAKGQDIEIEYGLAVGAVEYLRRPIGPDQLTARIDAILKKYRLGIYED